MEVGNGSEPELHASSPTAILPGTNITNFSTRASVQTDQGVTIAGFIVTGTASKQVVVRGLGPTLTAVWRVGGWQIQPCNSFDGSGHPFWFNDNWKDSQQTANSSRLGSRRRTIASPAILQNLATGELHCHPVWQEWHHRHWFGGSVRCRDGRLAELTNVSTRGFVGTGEAVMIGGFITGAGNGSTQVVVRGLGPTLAQLVSQARWPTRS